MRPCFRYRKSLALMASATGVTPRLREHLATCPGCRAYFQEMQRLCGLHRRSAEELLERTHNNAFDPSVVTVLRPASTGSFTPGAGNYRRMNIGRWMRLVGAAAVAIAIVFGGWRALHQQTQEQAPRFVGRTASKPSAHETVSSSRLIDLHKALSRSPAELDRQLDRALPETSRASGPKLTIAAARKEAGS